MFEPQKLFIGIIDFFAILLPGALLAFLVREEFRPFFAGYTDGAKGWVIFGFASYLFGHFIFLIGSGLDSVYDLLRIPTYQHQIKRLADKKRLSFPLFRYLSCVFFTKKNSDSAVKRAVNIKEFYLDPIEASASMNAFQWSKARLTLEQPEASAAVQRFEADSKFFRSLVILCILVLFLAWLGFIKSLSEVPYPWVVVPVLVLAFWRYMDQRIKATNQAYWYIIALEGKPDSKPRKKPSPAGPSHVGGVVYKKVFRKKTSFKYLLVKTKDEPDEWVLPIGGVKPAEGIKETAVREVREQSGVWAKITGSPVRVWRPVDGAIVPVEFYLMEAVESWFDKLFSLVEFVSWRLRNRWVDGERRRKKWLECDAAKAATDAESKSVLELARQTLDRREKKNPSRRWWQAIFNLSARNAEGTDGDASS